MLNFASLDWADKYINALYFSFITMVTVGYGDITPKTIYEKIFCIFMTLVSCVTFAYVVNTVQSILRERQIKSAEFKYASPSQSDHPFPAPANCCSPIFFYSSLVLLSCESGPFCVRSEY